jgi:lipoprotein-anchoring transpeptidase ErfK/SrfK
MHRRHFLSQSLCGVFTVGAAPALARIPNALPDYNMPEEQLPREVRIRNDFAPYEIHVDPGQYALYWTLPKKKAIRYSVGIGRTNLYEAGEFYVGAKKEWPSWTPTDEMIERDPASYAQFADGMPGGLNNPLGARALYLFTPERGDTFLRIHGTNSPKTIGRRVSNGCARLINDQMIDLYDRVPLQTRVVLYPLGGPQSN